MKNTYYYQAKLSGRYGKNGKIRDAVVDGDTVDMLCDLGFDVRMQLRLRLAKINTPESRTRNKAEKILGLKAKAFLKDVLESADRIEFESHDRGKYGRVLATLFVVGGVAGNGTLSINVNELLVKKKHARRYDGGKREPW